MPVVIEIDGSEVHPRRDPRVTLDMPLNGRATLRFSLNTDIHDRFLETTIFEVDGVTELFTGIIGARRIRGVAAGETERVVDYDCWDLLSYADYRFITLEHTEPVAFEDLVEEIVDDYLSDYGITYTPVSTGIVLAPFSWDKVKVSDALSEIAKRAQLAYRILPTKELVFFKLGEESGPVTLTDANSHCRELIWSDTNDLPANKVIMTCGQGQRVYTETVVTDGVSNEFEVSYPVSKNINDLYPNRLIVDGNVVGVIGWGPDQLPAGTNWYWDFSGPKGKLVNDTGVTYPAGHTITLTYTIQYPFVIEGATGATPVLEERLDLPGVLDLAQAEELKNAWLLKQTSPAQEISIYTLEHGFKPGQKITVNLASRSLTGTFIVTNVSLSIHPDSDEEDEVWEYTITAVNSEVYRESIIDEWKEMLGGGGGSSVSLAVASAVVPSGTTPTTFHLHVDLGGARDRAIAKATAAWTPVVDYREFVAPISFSGRVRVTLWARNAGVGVTARLYNVTDASSVGSSDKVVGVTPTDKAFLVSLTAGKKYRLEILSDTNGEGVYGIGTLETV